MNCRKPVPVLLGILMLSLFTLAAGELDIRFNPGEFAYIYDTNTNRGYFNAMLHNIAFINRSSDTVTLDRAVIEVIKDNKTCRSIILSGEELEKSAKWGHLMDSRGLLQLYDFFLQIKSFLGKSVTLTPTLQMKPNTAVISTWNYFTLKGIPGYFKVTVYGRTGKDKPFQVSAGLKAVYYKQANTFIFPVEGTWWVGAGADLYAHHRWVAIEEFALDLVKLDENGFTHKNEGLRVEDYYCFDRDVLAVADGEVVGVQTGLIDDNGLLKQKNESQQDYDRRLNAAQANMLKETPRHTGGNYIVIGHTGEEYSFYAHLKQGSITVKKGDIVKQGRVIGKVGHSGNSTEPHLHFHISKGAVPFSSRSVPVRFSNLHLFERSSDSFLRTGDIVRAAAAQHHKEIP